PAIVMELSEKDVLEISLIENIQRQDLNPIEEASAYKKLLSDFNLTQEDLSKRIGKSRTAITNTMRLMNLDIRVQQYIIEGII
ncbi:ParB/RepB/Spo0J family partition protein, partial [Clostridium paraputrificum]